MLKQVQNFTIAVVAACMIFSQAIFVSASAQPADPVVIVRSEALSVSSEKLGRTYDVQVKLPPGYHSEANAHRHYPVLYLTDAAFNFQLASAATQLPMNAGTIEDFIIVGIGYEQGADFRDSRIRDYTPTHAESFQRETGGAPAHLELIEEEIIPFVEARYRTDPKRRALAGHSLGGLFGVYVLFEKPHLFRHYIISSPSFWFDNSSILEFERKYAATHNDLDAEVYMSIGGLEHPDRHGEPKPRNHMVDQLREMERILISRNYPNLKLRATVVDGADHETVVPTILMNAVLWHFVQDRNIPFGY